MPALTRKNDAFYACGTHEYQRAGTMPQLKHHSMREIRRVRLLLILSETFKCERPTCPWTGTVAAKLSPSGTLTFGPLLQGTTGTPGLMAGTADVVLVLARVRIN